MTGDGVNDVLALKDADCSIAMASGSDAAAHAAQLVLLDSDFSKMPAVVREGRQVVNNLERSGSLFIVKNIFSAVAAVLSILIGFRYPLLPSQISLVTMWTIGVPSFFLSQMPTEELIRGRFIPNIMKKAIPAGLVDVLLILLTSLICGLCQLPEEQIFSACTLTFALVGIVYLYRVCRPFNFYRRGIWFGCLAGLTLFIILPFFRWFYRLVEAPVLPAVLIPLAHGLHSIPLLPQFDKLVSARNNKAK